MAGEINIGGIVGYLNLDRSRWTAEIDLARQQARSLGRENPHIDINTNAGKALAELASVAAAVKRLQDSQGKLGLAQQRLNDIESQGTASSGKLAKAHEDVARASRDVELAQIRVARAYEGAGNAADDATPKIKRYGDQHKSLFNTLTRIEILAPAVALALSLIGPIVAVAAVGLPALALGLMGLKDDIINRLTPAFKLLQSAATEAMRPSIFSALDHLQNVLPKLVPVMQVFAQAFGEEINKFASYLDNGGLEEFTNYAERNLPVVMSLLEDTTGSLVKLLAATSSEQSGTIDGIDKIIVGLGKIADLSGDINSKSGGVFTLGFITKNAKLIEDGGFTETVKGQGTQAIDLKFSESASRTAAGALDAAAATQAMKNQVDALSKSLPNADASLQGLISGLTAYGNSAGRAADKGALLASVLKASQGDALSYAGAVAKGYDAFHSLVVTFQEDTKNTQLGVISFRDTEKAAIDLNTGLINLKATGAVPLIGQLQAMQDAAANAASALYQHEVQTKGDSVALQDAQTIFESMTRGTLVANAAQLGLTKDQAQKLADQYFAMPDNVTTTVQSIGLTNINDTLNQIGQQLSFVTGHPWLITLRVDSSTLSTNLHDLVNKVPDRRAAGGPLGSGDTIVGEEGFELIRNGYVYNHAQSQAMLGVRGPSIGSPAASSASASYSAPAQGGTYRATVPIVISLDNKVLATSNAEATMVLARAN